MTRPLPRGWVAVVLPVTVVWLMVSSARHEAARLDDWSIASPESQGMSRSGLDALRDGLAARKTRALLVVRHDRIVYEWYADGQSSKERQGTASLAKAVVGGLSLAVALSDQLIALDDPVARYVPQWRGDARRSRITIRHLGSHTSGISDAESQNTPHDQLTGWKGDFWKRRDPPRDPFTLSRDEAPLLFEAGAQMQYSNPGIAMLTYAVTAAVAKPAGRAPAHGSSPRDIRTLLQDRIMRPIGVADEDWSIGYGQTFDVDGLGLVASWGGAAYTPRAAARIGRLLLHGGTWEGRRLLSAEAIRLVSSDAGTPGHGGMGWWSNAEGVDPRLPRDAYWGSGAGHQTLLIIPSLDLVIVRNGERLGESPFDPAGFHQPVSRYLSGPLMDALLDRATR